MAIFVTDFKARNSRTLNAYFFLIRKSSVRICHTIFGLIFTSIISCIVKHRPEGKKVRILSMIVSLLCVLGFLVFAHNLLALPRTTFVTYKHSMSSLYVHQNSIFNTANFSLAFYIKVYVNQLRHNPFTLFLPTVKHEHVHPGVQFLDHTEITIFHLVVKGLCLI